MIVQEINLYQDRFKEKKILLSSLHLLVLSGLLLLFLVFSSYWYNRQLQLVEDQNNDLQSNREQATRALEEQRNKLNILLADTRIDDQISKISMDISIRKRIFSFVSTNEFGSGKGFSSQLNALAEIQVNNVWLNEISLAEDDIKLTGSALQAEKIPEYFNLFRQRQLFYGKVFEDFELNRKNQQDWKVDFLIASQATLNE